MTRDDFNAFCESLPHTHHAVQWGGSDVWKVGSAEKNKVFAVAGWEPEDRGGEFAVSFHTSDIGFEMLRDAPGCKPAPYMAARGMTWIQRFAGGGVSDAELLDYLENSHRLMSLKLTKKLQKELGLNQDGGSKEADL